ncbi:MAG: hypothetical protein V1784_09825 [bacterium]
MKKRLTFILLVAAVAFLVWGLGGCLVSGVFTIDHAFQHDIHTSNTPTLDAREWETVHVDLTENETYRDHKDKLKGIESVCIVMDVKNNLDQNVSGEVWIAYDSLATKTEVMNRGTRIFSGIALGPYEERHFGCGDIQNILENLDAFEDAVKVGDFWVYGFGNEETYDVTFSHIVLIIIFAAGL